MKKHVQEVLNQIEINYKVKILYACESGSRAWGFPSKDSDYDVRFIYIYPRDWYLSIDHGRDVIEIPKNNSISIPIDELLDINGWELTKALRLFRKSNPPLLEWLHSSITYYEAFSTKKKLAALAEKVFSPASCLFHYLSMAKRNYREYLQGEHVKIKKCFYVLRPILAAKWIEEKNSLPPIEFQKMVDVLLPSGEVRKEIDILLKKKMAGVELVLQLRFDLIHSFLDKEIIRLEEYARSLNTPITDPTQDLNEIFRETLEEVWG